MPQVDGLWQRYKLNNDAKAREQIILAYSYLAKYAVDRMSVRPSAVIGYDDLLSYAVVGLINAVERFDPSRDVKFETYALHRIRGAVLDAIKELDWAPRSLRASEQELRKTVAETETKLGRAATDEEIASAMGCSVDEVADLFANVGQSAMLSLEDLVAGGDGTGVEQGSDDDDPFMAAERQERARILAQAIGDLPEKEKLVVSLYYREGMTFREISQILGVTDARVCQLHSKAVVRLHGKLARHEELLLSAA